MKIWVEPFKKKEKKPSKKLIILIEEYDVIQCVFNSQEFINVLEGMNPEEYNVNLWSKLT